MTSKFSRVVVKISGEAFCKEGTRGIDIEEARIMAREVHEAAKLAQVAIVTGGGNLVRGGEISREGGVQQITGDYMGMLGTLINALAMQDILEGMGTQTRVLSALQIHALAEPFIRRRAIRHLEKGRVTIFASGTGNPHFTTDTAAALKAAEIGAGAVIKATTKVDGVYDSDPIKNSRAKKYLKISYMDVINKKLGIMDATAITMAMELKLPVIVFNLKKPGNLVRVLRGEEIGTTISGARTVIQ
jgi:uridylate kinase